MVQISRQMIRINRDAIVESVSNVGQLNQPRLRPRPRAEREEGISDYNASSCITLQMFWQSAGPHTLLFVTLYAHGRVRLTRELLDVCVYAYARDEICNNKAERNRDRLKDEHTRRDSLNLDPRLVTYFRLF